MLNPPLFIVTRGYRPLLFHNMPSFSGRAPTVKALAYILIFIPDFGCFRLKQQLLRQKLRVFVCSELLSALESNKTLFPLCPGQIIFTLLIRTFFDLRKWVFLDGTEPRTDGHGNF